MASPMYRVQVRLDRDGALPEDVSVNTWHFEGDIEQLEQQESARWDQLMPGLRDRLVAFYQGIGLQLSATLAGTGTILMYDLRAPKPRAPRLTHPFTFTPGNSSLPGEVALCLSFDAARVSGVAQGRRRGRVFLGPLSGTVGSVVTGSTDVRPVQSQVDNILNQAKIMATGTNGAARLAIYSPTAHNSGASIEDAMTDAARLWIDDAFDVQRRRGSKATKRTVATI